MSLHLHGHGQVAQALLRLLPPGNVASIHTTRGVVFEAEAHGPDVFVDCTAPAYTGAARDAWNRRIEETLLGGTPVVTCNKAPLATAGPRLLAAAREGRASLSASATVGGGTPILPVVARLAPQVRSLRLVASGTLSSVCDSVAAGRAVHDAVHAAQVAGYAEPDPRLDLDGTDTLAKAVILHNTVWPDAITLDDIPERLSLHPGRIREIARTGGRPRVVATIERGRVSIAVRDVPWAGPAGDATVHIDAGRPFLLSGPGAGPAETAANLLADLQELKALLVTA